MEENKIEVNKLTKGERKERRKGRREGGNE